MLIKRNQYQNGFAVLVLIIVVVVVAYVGYIIYPRREFDKETETSSFLDSEVLPGDKFDDSQLSKEQIENERAIEQFKDEALILHSDLVSELASKKIYIALPFEIVDSGTHGWVIGATDRSFSENPNDSDALPNHQYLVLDTFWKDLHSPTAIEFKLAGVEAVKNDLGSNRILVSSRWATGGFISLFELNTGERILLTDPKNLISPDDSWMIDDQGNSAGTLGPEDSGNTFTVYYGHAVTYARGTFDTETGELLDLEAIGE